jgi:hypothetical protein
MKDFATLGFAIGVKSRLTPRDGSTVDALCGAETPLFHGCVGSAARLNVVPFPVCPFRIQAE